MRSKYVKISLQESECFHYLAKWRTLPGSADVMGAKEQQKYPAVAVQTERESESVEPSPETLMARIALNMR